MKQLLLWVWLILSNFAIRNSNGSDLESYVTMIIS